MSDDVKRMDVAEFRREGYLQELNRRFLHPLGLALEVVRDESTEEEWLGGVWDYRDEPEGIVYEGLDLAAKAAHVDALWVEHAAARLERLGYVIQPARPDAS